VGDELLIAANDGSTVGSRIFSYHYVPIACCTIDINGFIMDCNELFASLFGYARKDLLEASFLDFTSNAPERLIQTALTKTNNQRSIFSQRVWLKKKDGSTFPAVVNIKRLEDEHGNVKFGNVAIVDDTFNYSTIVGVEKDKEELKRKERLKNEFVAIASHELRTPIQPILGFALLARRGTISQEEAWEGVLGEARRLQQLANDILDVSRIESDNLKFDFAKVKIHELIQHAIDSFKSDLSKDISILLDHNLSEADLQIDADRSRITQVISNIIGNAIKFTQKGVIRIEIRAFHDKNIVEIRISDTGEGIPADVLPRLFEKFVTKGHGEGTKKGTGLGLYISQAIVHAHNGDISAANNAGGGTTFSISLPISRQLNQLT